MASSKPKEHILELLSATGYCLNLKPEQLSSIENNESLKTFFDWFVANISQENCVNSEELEEFNQLEKEEKVLYSTELEDAIQSYHDPRSNHVPFTDLYNESIADEYAHLKEQIVLKTNLQSLIKDTIDATTDDNIELSKELKIVNSHNSEALRNVFSSVSLLNKKLEEATKIIDDMQQILSELDQGVELSIDEGFNTMTSADKLNISMCSTISTQSSASNKFQSSRPGSRFPCQLPFDQYYQMRSQLLKHIDGLSNWKAEKYEEPELELDLELSNILERLTIQKHTYISSVAKLHGIKAALSQIRAIKSDLENGLHKQAEMKLSELSNIEEDSSDLDSSLILDQENLNIVCEKWSEAQILKSVHNILEEKVKTQEALFIKLQEITKDLNAAVIVDEIISLILHLNLEFVEYSVTICVRLRNTMRKKLEDIKKRTEIMETNYQDYNDYLAIPVEERCEVVEWLAAMVGSDKKNLVQKITSMGEESIKSHKMILDYYNERIQDLISLDHSMKEVHKEMQEHRAKISSECDHERIQSIQSTLLDMSTEIFEATKECQTIQGNGLNREGENKIENMLKSLILQHQRGATPQEDDLI